jgi:hypothetical protein
MKTGIAIILTGVVLAGIAITLKETHPPVPKLTEYRVTLTSPGQAGHTDPPVVAPGDKVTLTVSADRKSVFGKWRAIELEAAAAGEWKPTGIGTQTEPWDQAMEFGYAGRKGLSAETVNRPMQVWIRFRLPKDTGLSGRTLSVKVVMKIEYPFTTTGESYEEATTTVDRTVAFRVGTKEEIAEYRRWRSDVRSWTRRSKLYSQLANLSFGVLALSLIVGIFFIIRKTGVPRMGHQPPRVIRP